MLTTMLATAKRNYYIAKRVFPWSFIVQRIVIGLYTVLFSYFIYHYMFRGYLDSRFETYTGSSDYITYTILGVSLYTFAVSTLMNVGRSLMNELREGTLEALLLSPCSRKGYFLGNLIEQVGRSFLEFFVVLIVGWLLGAKLLNIKIEQLIIVLILSIFSFFSMGVSLATVMLRTRDTYITQNTLFIIVSLVCGISYPIQYLPT
ncbi:MAG: ABC transporter permease, partial [Bacillota bacterium]|nr:ABC transporter permease [Bacillota bacterium]